MKRIGYILLVLIILFALPFIFGKRIVERVALQMIEEATGFRASVGDIDVRILRPVVRIQDLTLSNPPEFPYPEMLHIRELYVRYDWITLFGDNVHLDEVRIDVPRIVMVKPETGKSNVELLADLASSDDGGVTTPSPKEPPPPAPAPAPSGEEQPIAIEPAKREQKLTIERLNIKLGEMEVRQYMANRSDPVIMPIPVGLDSTFTDVSDLDPVITQLSGELIFRSSIGVLS
ncbi:MAG: AsmA family protein, partial [Kiritimatiellia bacterium]